MQEQSTDNQLPDLEALASRRGFDIVRVFSENVSAMKARPEFDAMIAAAHRGKFDVLLVWSFDRLHRSMVGALQTVLDLDLRSVQVVSYKEPWLDTGGPVRSLLIGIFGWVTTMTSDAKFLRGAAAQGVNFDAFLHAPVPLQGLSSP